MSCKREAAREVRAGILEHEVGNLSATWSTRRRATDWMDTWNLPGTGEPLKADFLSGGTQNVIYRISWSRVKDCVPRRPTPARPRQGHPARVADHRGGRRHRPAPHRGRVRVCPTDSSLAGPSTDGVRRRLTPCNRDSTNEKWPPALRYGFGRPRSLGVRARRGHGSSYRWIGRPRAWRGSAGRTDSASARSTGGLAFFERSRAASRGPRRGDRLAARPQAARLHPWLDARRLPVRQRDVPPRSARAVGRDRQLGDGRVGNPKLDLGWMVQSWPGPTNTPRR